MTDFWISNASPLITLTAVGRLDLFAALKCEIRVPLAVLEELRAGATEDRTDEAVRKAGTFVIVEDVAIPTNVDRWGLDPEEAQVVSQVLTTGAKGVILDDLAGPPLCTGPRPERHRYHRTDRACDEARHCSAGSTHYLGSSRRRVVLE